MAHRRLYGAAGADAAGAGAALAQDEATPEAEAPYYSDTQGPPVPGGTADFLLYEDPDSLNPWIGQTSIASQVTAAILEGLTYNDPDGNFQPELAAELPTQENGGVSEDLTTITWKLKPDVLWSDGTPFTSEDVKFTWEAVRDVTNSSAFASDFELITDIQTPDPTTAVVNYSAFNAGYLDQFPWILPKHATGPVEEMATWEFNRAPIGPAPSSCRNGRRANIWRWSAMRTTARKASPTSTPSTSSSCRRRKRAPRA